MIKYKYRLTNKSELVWRISKMREVKTCCFTGHRPQTLGFGEKTKKCDNLKEQIRTEIVKLIENEGVRHFISGMAVGVDTYAAKIVLELKKSYPDVTLECAIPCENQAEKWHEPERNTYFDIIEHCDKETLLQKQYTPDCMQKRNEYMVDHSDFVIAVWNGKPSGTGNTVNYAKLKNKRIVIINANR